MAEHLRKLKKQLPSDRSHLPVTPLPTLDSAADIRLKQSPSTALHTLSNEIPVPLHLTNTPVLAVGKEPTAGPQFPQSKSLESLSRFDPPSLSVSVSSLSSLEPTTSSEQGADTPEIHSVRLATRQSEHVPVIHSDEVAVKALQDLKMKNAALHQLESMVKDLESRNEEYLRKIQSQSAVILELSQWESRAHKAERKVEKLVAHQSSHKSQQVAGLEEKLATCERNLHFCQSQKQQMQNANISVMASMDLELQQQRVHVMELEEELDRSQMAVTSNLEKVSELSALVLSKDAEISSLKESLLLVNSVEEEHSSLIHSLQSSLDEKASVVDSLTSELDLVSKRMKQLQDELHAATASSVLQLYDQISGRGAFTIELHSGSQGFTYEVVPAQVFAAAPSIIVKEAIASDCVLLPGDEILEVNGYICRSSAQPKALQQLTALLQGTASAQLVIARADELSPLVLHSRLAELEELLKSTKKELQMVNEEKATLTIEVKSTRMANETANKKLEEEKGQSVHLQEIISHKKSKIKEMNALMGKTQVTSYAHSLTRVVHTSPFVECARISFFCMHKEKNGIP